MQANIRAGRQAGSPTYRHTHTQRIHAYSALDQAYIHQYTQTYIHTGTHNDIRTNRQRGGPNGIHKTHININTGRGAYTHTCIPKTRHTGWQPTNTYIHTASATYRHTYIHIYVQAVTHTIIHTPIHTYRKEGQAGQAGRDTSKHPNTHTHIKSYICIYRQTGKAGRQNHRHTHIQYT